MNPAELAAPVAEVSIWSMFLHASIVVQAVMIGLLAASVWCWTIIVDKTLLFRRTRKAMDQFEETFWSGRSLEELYTTLSERPTSGMASLFVAAMREWKRSFQAAGASFVSGTQSFNTATSIGRLTLNMLLSFAQFEREVTAERIRDKIAASKRKGLWMGGQVPLGYEADGRTLRINAEEARTVRTLYALYDRLGTVRAVKAEADRLDLVTKVRSKPDGSRTGGLQRRQRREGTEGFV